MKLHLNDPDAAVWQVYLNGQPVDAIWADEEAQAVEILVKDQEGMPILNEQDECFTVRLSGRVEIKHRSMAEALPFAGAGNVTIQ